jgi:ABC-type amino acid transport substrate-binding protein
MTAQDAATPPDSAGPGHTRRGLLAAPFLVPAAVHAQAADDSLTGLARRGALRVNIGTWTAGFVSQPGTDEPRMRDGFHEGMARQIAQQLGVRAELVPAQRSGDGMRRLLAGEVDLALAPPITRVTLREIMFCSPHLAMDLVLLGHAPPTGERGRPNLDGMRLGALEMLVPALTDRRVLVSVMPVQTPPELARRLLDGALDGIIVTSVMADAAQRRFPEAKLRVLRALTTAVFAGAVAYGAHDLRRAINTVTDQMLADGRLAALFRRETGLPFNPPAPG